MRWWTLMLLAACTSQQPGLIHKTGTDTAGDTKGPVIQSTPIDGAQPYGQDVLVSASATEEKGDRVVTISVYYQAETDVSWNQKAMTLVGGDLYQGTIPGADVTSGGMRYYIEATDTNGNATCDPAKCDQDAWHFNISAP